VNNGLIARGIVVIALRAAQANISRTSVFPPIGQQGEIQPRRLETRIDAQRTKVKPLRVTCDLRVGSRSKDA